MRMRKGIAVLAGVAACGTAFSASVAFTALLLGKTLVEALLLGAVVTLAAFEGNPNQGSLWVAFLFLMAALTGFLVANALWPRKRSKPPTRQELDQFSAIIRQRLDEEAAALAQNPNASTPIIDWLSRLE